MDDPNDYADWKHRVDHDGLYASALYRLWFESVKRLKYRFGHRRFDLGVVHVLEEHLKGTQEALLGIQQVGRELGARTLLLLVPQEDEVNDPSIDVAHHDLMAKFADEHGLDVVRVPQAWRAAAPIRGRYLERDPVHLNATGYRELAAAVASSPLLQEAAGKATSRN